MTINDIFNKINREKTMNMMSKLDKDDLKLVFIRKKENLNRLLFFSDFEKFDLKKVLVLKIYFEHFLYRSRNILEKKDEIEFYEQQLKFINDLLDLKNIKFCFIEYGFLHIPHHYGYTFNQEIGRLYSISKGKSIQHVKKSLRYLLF